MGSMFVKVAGVSLSVVRGPRLDILHWGMERPGSGPQVLRPASDLPPIFLFQRLNPLFLLYPTGSASHTAHSLATHSSQTFKGCVVTRVLTTGKTVTLALDKDSSHPPLHHHHPQKKYHLYPTTANAFSEPLLMGRVPLRTIVPSL